jgi:acylphosphatase
MRKHLNIHIFGKVVGVGFRWEAKNKAEELGIAGFVINKPDGTLYIEAEGEQVNLEIFVDWCAKGPFWAKVERVEREEGEVRQFKDFKIER